MRTYTHARPRSFVRMFGFKTRAHNYSNRSKPFFVVVVVVYPQRKKNRNKKIYRNTKKNSTHKQNLLLSLSCMTRAMTWIPVRKSTSWNAHIHSLVICFETFFYEVLRFTFSFTTCMALWTLFSEIKSSRECLWNALRIQLWCWQLYVYIAMAIKIKMDFQNVFHSGEENNPCVCFVEINDIKFLAVHNDKSHVTVSKNKMRSSSRSFVN